MVYQAVVFDLYGTLVDNYGNGDAAAGYNLVQGEIADLLGLPREVFERGWRSSRQARLRGGFASLEAELAAAAAGWAPGPTPAQLEQAASARRRFIENFIMCPRPDAIEMLVGLRDRGLKSGLITNCSYETSDLWGRSPLSGFIDAPILSCQAGLAKPDSRIFALACERLGVAPEEAIYVADGEGGELAAAQAVGMAPVLIRGSYADPPYFRQSQVEPWQGQEIGWLKQVLDLV